jgi:chaperonin cofactor prefoldin
MPKLYELTGHYKNLIDLLDDDSIPQEEIMAAIQQVDGEIVIKAQEMAKLLKNIGSDANAYEIEEKRLKAKRQSLERRYDGIKDYLEGELIKAGVAKVSGVVPLSFRKSPPSVNVIDAAKIPDNYMVPKPAEPDKKTILEDLKGGKEIPGVELVTDKKYLKIG